jgi:hypothetical protein
VQYNLHSNYNYSNPCVNNVGNLHCSLVSSLILIPRGVIGNLIIVTFQLLYVHLTILYQLEHVLVPLVRENFPYSEVEVVLVFVVVADSAAWPHARDVFAVPHVPARAGTRGRTRSSVQGSSLPRGLVRHVEQSLPHVRTDLLVALHSYSYYLREQGFHLFVYVF